MAISYNKKVIFVHIPKTAGTSIILQPEYKFKNTGHLNVMDYQNKYPEEWNNFSNFTVVRNPWDRLASCYNYARMEKSYWHGENNPHKDHKLLKNSSFKEMVLLLSRKDPRLTGDAYTSQISRLLDSQGNMAVADVFRYEEIREKSNPRFEEMFPKLKHVNPSKWQYNNYRDYYDSESKELVDELYFDDIQIFGYTY